MTWDDLYDDAARERIVPEPAKRVPAPVRTPFERDRARVVHSASLRRLAAKTQVVGPQSDDFVRNRLTHSLEVAQIARDLAHPLGCHPDLTETAALAHDLGHPPFGHNGERALNDLAQGIGGFEGNAQTLRILTRLEAKTADADGRSVGLNLTRATLDACTKYPWAREDAREPLGVHTDGVPKTLRKFGVYDDDRPVFDWMRSGVDGPRRCVEAQVMDFADDVAYSVHDLEDGIVAGKIDLTALTEPAERAAVWRTARSWYLPDGDDAALDDALLRMQRVDAWPDAPYDGSRRGLAALKNLTSDLIGIFCGNVQQATREAFGDRPLVRHRVDVVIPGQTALQIAVLKGIAAHYVMQAAGRVSLMSRQRAMLRELFEALAGGAPAALDPQFRRDFSDADDDGARRRVLVDQLASLTDASALAWHARLCGTERR
ncbi:deoxyguanosinetriphosphate triphosphohydrolase [Nocardioides terrisoli]|uniref:deoxyguanosinetriphosphate triphosphohydrolase n=1 Tax=Nocardioides terrisoli TaxID=3388267 RepID=UPI00287B8646|nr:deoxyguanosinetriphosphate triphosphohydrolase [Nocardioides marmorisolisilvae]